MNANTHFTQDQLDGLSCLLCGNAHAIMRPVAVIDHTQVFTCLPHSPSDVDRAIRQARDAADTNRTGTTQGEHR